jgi:radical SAM superfamily enzyme YgiQ (UPF0313 family)
LRAILAAEAKVVGISVYSTEWSVRRALLISRSVKAESKSTTVVWGGWHPSLYGRCCIQNDCVDVVLRGPAERSVCDLLDVLEKSSSMNGIVGACFKEDGSIIETGMAEVDQKSLFPRLDFDVIDVGRYVRCHDQGPGRLEYTTSRGCYGRCAFCASPRIDKRRRFRKPKGQCVDDLRYLLARHPVDRIVFSDGVGFANESEALDLADIVSMAGRGRKLRWRCDTRADALARLSDGAFRDLIRSGCTGLALGVESGTDRVLGLMKKDITVAQVSRALARMKAHGLEENLLWFMVGFPGETADEASRTVGLACEARAMFPKSSIVLKQYHPGIGGSAPEQMIGRTRMQVAWKRIDGTSSQVVAYYLAGSAETDDKAGVFPGVFRRLYQRMLSGRVKHRFFNFPWEYYLFRLRKTLHKCLRLSLVGLGLRSSS